MIAGLKPYPAYKDSRVPWLGKVPEGWMRLPGRACYREKMVPNTGLKEMTVLSLSYGQIVVKPPEKLHGLVPASFETYQIVEPTDIIVRPTDLQNDKTSLRFSLSRKRGIITSAYMCLQTKSVLTPEYGHLLLHTYDLKKVFYGLGSGLRQNLAWQDFKYLPCFMPSPAEQAAIVRFLDHTDWRIRRYIQAKQKLIKLLEEQKQAIIHRAVTRGLDPNVKLKNSGVEWLGEVPEHWEVVPLGRLLAERNEKNDPIKTNNILSLSLHDGVILYADKRPGGNKAKEDLTAYKLVYPGDIVLNSMNVVVGSVGLSKYFGAVSPVYYMLRPRSPDDRVEYFDAIFQDKAFQISLFGLGNGIMVIQSKSTGRFNTIRMRIPLGKLNRVDIPHPREAEQIAIIQYLNQVNASFDNVTSKARREVQLLQEYRTCLIADVVTGKLDVREAAANLPEETDKPDTTEAIDELATDDASTLGNDLDATPEEVQI